MVKRQQVNNSDIKYSRELTPNDDLEPLTSEINANGMKFPIVVDEDMNLIDGLRRLKALDSLSLVDEFPVTVVVCTTLEETLSWVSKTTKHGVGAVPVTPLRAWQMFSDTYPQQKKRTAEGRKRRTGLPRGEHVGSLPRSRELLNEALGHGPGEAMVSVSTSLYKQFVNNVDPNMAKPLAEIRSRLEAGELTIYEAKGLVDRLAKGEVPTNQITNLNDQRDALAITLSQFTGANKGLARIGNFHSSMTESELNLYLKGFMEARRELSAFINNLRKRATTP